MAGRNLLFVSNLFPDTSQLYRGLDNATLLGAMASDWNIRVIAPRPTLGVGRSYACRAEDAVFDPVYPHARYVPRIGSAINHRLMARAIRAGMSKLGQFRPQAILCSWLYPDGCGTALVAQERGLPFASIAQGSDVHQYLNMPVRREVMLACLKSAALITRSRDLRERLCAAGFRGDMVETIYNGVDLETFHPGDQEAARRQFGLPRERKVLLFVGNLLPIKQPLLLVEAHARLCGKRPESKPLLVLIGAGPLRAGIVEAAERAGTACDVLLAGRKTSSQIADAIRAVDLLCLSSVNEGVPNVVLEALAGGLPVVAPSVGGLGEIVNASYLGRLARPNDADALACAMGEVLDAPRDTARIREYATRFAWRTTAERYSALLKGAMASFARR